MGQAALIFVLGMTIVMGRMLVSSNEQIISLSQKITARYEKIIARYIAISGANIALSNLSDNPQWRTNIASSFNGGAFAVTVTDLDSVVELSITGTYLDLIRTIEIITTARAPLEDLAIYTTGTVTNVVVLDEFSNPDPTLLVENQSSLPDIDDQELIDLATFQDQVEDDDEFSPDDGYPNGPPGSFYYSDPTANVTHVLHDLRVKKDRTVYGIFLVEGNIVLEGSARVEGVLYLKNSGQTILSGSGRNRGKSYVTGGIVANGDIGDIGNQIDVTYNSAYMINFSATTNVTGQGGVEVISWKEL